MKFGTRVRVARYQPAAVLRISGEDALTFLQGQFTQELRTPKKRASGYGLWLNQKGKVVADSFILQTDGGVCWAISYQSFAQVIRERLENYIIADDVTLEDETDKWTGLAAFGAGVSDWLATQGVELPVKGTFAETVNGMIWRGRRGAELSVEWLTLAKVANGDALRDVELLSTEDLERMRITAGIPTVPRDVGPGDLPNEAGLEDVAISYSKGCYLGQEVMARLKAMGQVRRRLLRVRGKGEAPATMPAPLFHGDKRVGDVRSAVCAEDGAWLGLAMILLTGLPAERMLSLSAGGIADVRVEALAHD